MLYVVGANSRLYRSMNLGCKAIEFTVRIENVRQLPTFPENAAIVIFSDPEDSTRTGAIFNSILSCVPYKSACRIVFISSISAQFYQSRHYPIEGAYARRKRTAEEILLSRTDLSVTIIRAGNIFSHGGWREIQERSKFAILPHGFNKTATSTPQEVADAISEGLSHESGHRHLNIARGVETSSIFRRVVFVSGLLSVYRMQWARQPLKVLARVFRLMKIYLPSPDDINSFLVK